MAKKMTRPTPKPDFIPGKPGKATRKEPTAKNLIEEAIAAMQKSERFSDADRAALGRMINPEKKQNFKKGGAVKMEEGGKAISDADQNKMRRLLMQMSVDEKGKSISDADKKRVKKVVKMKDGGGVCRGGRSAERGTSFRGVR